MILLPFGIRPELRLKKLYEIEWKNMKELSFIRKRRKMIEMTEVSQ